MRRYTDCDGVLPTGDHVVHVGRAPHHHGERSRPESLGEPRGALWNLAHPAMQVTRAVEVDDHRMVGRTLLELEDPAHGGRILRVGAESVDGLGRKSHELTVAQRLHGSFDLDLGGSDDTDHKMDSDSIKPTALR